MISGLHVYNCVDCVLYWCMYAHVRTRNCCNTVVHAAVGISVSASCSLSSMLPFLPRSRTLFQARSSRDCLQQQSQGVDLTASLRVFSIIRILFIRWYVCSVLFILLLYIISVIQRQCCYFGDELLGLALQHTRRSR